MEVRQTKLADVLKRVRTDESDSDFGRTAKRQETEQLRAALASGSSASVSSGLTSVPFGIHEGQTVVNFPAVKNYTGVKSRARADGYMWDPLTEQDAMKRQPYAPVLTELGRIQAIIGRDPNKRFINMYATKTNQRVQSLYDQDKLRILASRESELAHARHLDRARKIVGTEKKDKQLELLRKELAIVGARHARALNEAPRLSAMNSRLGDYLDSGQKEDTKSFEYLVETKNEASFIDRMAFLYTEIRRDRALDTDAALSQEDKQRACDMLRTMWSNLNTTSTGPTGVSTADTATARAMERDLVSSDRLMKAGTNERVLELLLSGYALNMCQISGANEDAHDYTELARNTLAKALNFFFIGISQTNIRPLPPSIEKFVVNMAPYSRSQYNVGGKEEPYRHDAATSLIDILGGTVYELGESISDSQNINPGGIVDDKARTVRIQEAENFVRALYRSLMHLASRVHNLRIPSSRTGGTAERFEGNLLNLIMAGEKTARATFETWRTTNPRLSSVLTASDGAFVSSIAACMAGTFETLRKPASRSTDAEKELVDNLSYRGLLDPAALDDVFQVLKMSLTGFFSELHAYLVLEGALSNTKDELDIYRLRRDDPFVSVVPLEEVFVPGTNLSGPADPLRFMFGMHALNSVVGSSTVPLRKLLNSFREQYQRKVSEKDNVQDVKRIFGEYTDVDGIRELPVIILMQLARIKFKLAESSTEADRLLMDKIADDIQAAGSIIGDIAAERSARHGILHPGDDAAWQNQRDTYQQPLAWAQMVEISGHIFLSPNVTGQWDSAQTTLGDDVPALRGIPLETLTTEFSSGLAAYFCEYAAVMHARDELGHSTGVVREKQYAAVNIRFMNVVQRLRRYSYSKVGPRVTVYCAGRTYAPPPSALSDMTGAPSVGLF